MGQIKPINTRSTHQINAKVTEQEIVMQKQLLDNGVNISYLVRKAIQKAHAKLLLDLAAEVK